MKFYRCAHCGNIIVKLTDAQVPVSCCGEPMQLLDAGSTDASREKHVPVVRAKDGSVSVSVGQAEHPMTDEHRIEWITLETDRGFQVKWLTPDKAPEIRFSLAEDEAAERVYAYCNLHGLWEANLSS
jgi:superoxide reductase